MLNVLSWILHSPISASWRARESFSSSLAYYSSSWSSSNLVIVTRELCQSLFCLEYQLPLDSSNCSTQTISTHAHWLSFSPLVCRLRKLSEVLYLLTWARAWNPNFSPRNISYVPWRFKIVFGASILNRLTLLNYHVVIKTCMSNVRNIHRQRLRFSTLSGALRT